MAVNIIGHEVIEQVENVPVNQNILNEEVCLTSNNHCDAYLPFLFCIPYQTFSQQERSSSITTHNTNTDFNLEHWIQVIQNAEEESAQGKI